MFRISSRIKYQIPGTYQVILELAKNKNAYQINKFMKTILLFDGSMTNLVANLTEGNPKVQILYQKKISKNEIQNQSKKLLIQQQGYFLSQGLNYDKLFFNSQKSSEVIERSIIFNINKQKSLAQSQESKKLYYARSFWNLNAYNEIMSKNPSKPIGHNLINLKIPLFRQINWIGKADLQIQYKKLTLQNFKKSQKESQFQPQSEQIISIKEKQIFCRSYTMLSQSNLVLCQLQEFFLDDIIQIFK